MIRPTNNELSCVYSDPFVGIKKLAKRYGASEHRIKTWLAEAGIKLKIRGGIKRFHHNDDFFKTWSPEMAYILGFIAADGHIRKNQPALEIGLNPKDTVVLEYIRDHISPGTRFYYYKDKCVRLFVVSQPMVLDLAKYSVTNEKTFHMKLDFHIPEEYFHHYLRGFFDGDGTAGIVDNYVRRSSFCCASHDFLRVLREKTGNLGFLLVCGNLLEWRLSHHATATLAKIMYPTGNEFGLLRKKEKLFWERSRSTDLVADVNLTC